MCCVGDTVTSQCEDNIDVQCVDVRDYHLAYKDDLVNTINIPLPYLKRYYKEINRKTVHLIGRDEQEISRSAHFLKRKGYRISGSTIQ
ncbi:hypothetical protein AN965_14235 [Alkalicoccobacillus plakortidis]|uniref:Rhodanese domain-containing protein n=1 Tax=Alkalicoccobacillus plakortidis TaxID=444060 RepID=A0A9D5I159_9BACI|nr:hypothetical protein AN965_14235 [Alkalicoccobacillus plakortidis]